MIGRAAEAMLWIVSGVFVLLLWAATLGKPE